MRKNRFAGWRDVFSFTFRQTGKSKSFMATTVGITVLFAVVMILINVFAANSDNASAPENNGATQGEDGGYVIESTSIETVYYGFDLGLDVSMEDIEEESLDMSDSEIEDWSNYNFDSLTTLGSIADNLSDPYKNITFTQADGTSSEMITKLKETSEPIVFLNVTFDVEGLNFQLYLPQNNMVSWEDANGLLFEIMTYIEESRLSLIGLNEEQREFSKISVLSEVVTSETDYGSVSYYLNEYVPMVFCLLLYMMVVLYGQLVATSVATEKSSRVMELLLTSIQPFAIILGKVVAVFSLAMIQIGLFIGAVLVGNVVGEQIAIGINPTYSNVVLDVLKETNLFAGLSIGNIIMSILFFAVGFLLFNILAGLVGATVSRGEDLGSALSTYQGVVVAGFMLAYLPQAMLIENAMVRIARYIPISSPFTMPSDILMGNVSTGTLLVAFGILCITVVILVYIVAQVYEMIILHSGNKIGLKEIFGLLKIK